MFLQCYCQDLLVYHGYHILGIDGNFSYSWITKCQNEVCYDNLMQNNAIEQ